MYDVWPEEIKKWSQFNDTTIDVFHGRGAEGIGESTADIVIVNFDYIQKLFGGLAATSWTPRRFAKTYGFDSLVVDELSAFKNTQSKRFKMLKRVVESFTYRYGLTGSPVANRLLDIFGQAYILDSGKTFGEYITHFRNKYFVPAGYMGYDWKVAGAVEEKEIFRRLKPLALRLSAEDWLKMPQLIIHDIPVSLTAVQMRQYKELEDDLITVLNDDKTVTAPTKAAALNKCRQFVSGQVYAAPRADADDQHYTGRDMVHHVHDVKISALSELVDELQGEPLLIGVGFRFEVEALRKVFGKNLPAIFGGTKNKEASATIKKWNEGEIPVLAAHPASMAHGVNLQYGGKHIAWLTMPWDFELYDQFNRRLYRQGAKGNKVFIHRICARDTIDEYVRAVLVRKRVTQDGLFSYLRRAIRR